MSQAELSQSAAVAPSITPGTSTWKCHWNSCPGVFANTPSLVSHLESSHLSLEDEAKCKWTGCEKYGVEQESKDTLRIHCQSHIFEELACPLPECDERFSRPDQLAKHVKSVHELQTLREAVYKAKSVENKSEGELLKIIEQNYELKSPWWFGNKFVGVLNGVAGTEDHEDSTKKRKLAESTEVPVRTLYKLPLDFKQHKVASLRYKNFVENKSLLFGPGLAPTHNMNIIRRQKLWERLERSGGEEDDQEEELALYNQQFHDHIEKDSDGIKRQYKKLHTESLEHANVDELKRVYTQMENQLHTANRINQIVSEQLEKCVQEKRQLWLINQLLVDANVELGIPPEESQTPQRVIRDKYDEELLNR
ncbi:uncharacterized protein CANTADRAFT_308060 [Suhomyces tanzawaensis NRRL Y-17324]|uniref:C2H2-type domain-containing protein n=1 Tax=Suhomyces tanzawaensis NRRL Y-17324 TaxID=984487 RepID=A0A1E4SD09_9ASCO|nr:uncharacterized protein CANTADRAFT_308060 [Suhomyces tanzawaensis NRRL Y-17324]ODV77404.1 hypothetical protein CANTADRAFT_308060 [Suhomyces tanzawaensis NRRL Y-17324]